MTKSEWKEKIIGHCKSLGTFKEEFAITYDLLADTLYQLEEAQKTFEESGEEVIIRHVNNSGASNWAQHPALRMCNDLKRDALTYLRDCGLTCAALRKINDDALDNTVKRKSPLAEALAKLG